MVRGPRVVSPPTSSIEWASAAANMPAANASSHASSASGSAIASRNQRGSAPIAARSERFTASDLYPRRCASAPGRKCVPSESVSVVSASTRPVGGRTSAQSSPTPSAAVRAGRVKYFAISSNSESMKRQLGLLSFVWAQPRRELVEHAVHVLVPVGAAVLLGELDGLVDHHAVRHLWSVLQLPRREQQDAALDRRERLDLAVEGGLDLALQVLARSDRAGEELVEVLRIGLREVRVGGEVRADVGRRVAGDLPLVEALQRVLARAASCGLHGSRAYLWFRSMARSAFASSTATAAQSRPLAAARAAACASVLVVRMPFATGTPVSSWTWLRPAADSFDTTSKW